MTSRLLLTVLLLLGGVAEASADSYTYFIPVMLIQTPRGPMNVPKYLTRDCQSFPACASPRWTVVPNKSFSVTPYGMEPWAIVTVDLTQGQHASLIANADVVPLTSNLDATLSEADASSLSAKLAIVGMPSSWVAPKMSWRDSLDTMAGIAEVTQRFSALTKGKLVRPGVGLNTPIGDLPPQTKNALFRASDDLKFNRKNVKDTTTVGEFLTTLGSQRARTVRRLGGRG